MSRLWGSALSLILAAAACGGSQKPASTPPLPDDKPAASAQPPAKPEAPAEKPAEPPKPTGPVEVKISAPQTTVKLVSAGKGKKEQLRYTPKQGNKQQVELALDFGGKQDTDEELIPTIVLTGEAETTTVDKDGSEYTLKVTGFDARDVKGAQIPADKFKQALGSLTGLTIGGKLASNGVPGETTLRIEQPQEHAADSLELIRQTLPSLPVLPTEAVGVGAKWQATSTLKIADRLEVTHTTDYELVAHKGATWTIKGTTKVSGADQDVEGGKISGISGTGTSEATIADGTLYPTYKTSLETQFKASEKDKSSQFVIKIASAVTPKQ